MRSEGEIKKRRREASEKADKSTSMMDYDGQEKSILDWVLFDNECPECHHDCQKIGAYEKNKGFTYYVCNNCEWSNYENIMQTL